MKQIEGLRADTPGVSNIIHFNNAGAALPPSCVVDAQVNHLKLEANVGPQEAAQQSAPVRQVYSQAATLLGCSSTEIAFMDSASRAWNSFLYALNLQPGDEVITSRIEFGTNLLTLKHVAREAGAVVRIATAEPDGTIDLTVLEKCITQRTKLLAISHAAAHFGGLNPVEEIGQLIQDKPIVYLVDACQSLGQIPVNIERIRCHALTGTGRKWLRGPRGSAILYVQDNFANSIEPRHLDVASADLVPPLMDSCYPDISTFDLRIREGAKRFELWERSVAAEIGLSAAIDYLLTLGIDAIHQRIKSLAQRIVENLSGRHGISVLGANQESGVIGVVTTDVTPEYVRKHLASSNINVSVMYDYDAPLDFLEHGTSSTLRISPHYYNAEEEIDLLCDEIQRLVET